MVIIYSFTVVLKLRLTAFYDLRLGILASSRLYSRTRLKAQASKGVEVSDTPKVSCLSFSLLYNKKHHSVFNEYAPQFGIIFLLLSALFTMALACGITNPLPKNSFKMLCTVQTQQLQYEQLSYPHLSTFNLQRCIMPFPAGKVFSSSQLTF